jgi:hypothetical protein
MSRFSRSFAVLLLILLVLPVALQAAPLQTSPPARTVWSVLAQVWSFLTAQSDNGCRLDPNGLCLPGQSAPAMTDNGCLIEPDGRCLPGQAAAAAADNGCLIEPNGRCRD